MQSSIVDSDSSTPEPPEPAAVKRANLRLLLSLIAFALLLCGLCIYGMHRRSERIYNDTLKGGTGGSSSPLLQQQQDKCCALPPVPTGRGQHINFAAQEV